MSFKVLCNNKNCCSYASTLLVSERDTFVLNANLVRYILYMEVRMSPLSVAWAPHYVKEAELGHSHFLGCGMGGVKYLPLDTVQALKMF